MLIFSFKQGTGAIDPNAPEETLVQTLSNFSNIRQVKGDSSGNYFVHGAVEHLVKFNSDATMAWSRDITGAGGNLAIKDILPMDNGDIFVSGTDEVYNPQTDNDDDFGTLLKIDSTGSLVSSRNYSGMTEGTLTTDGTDVFLSDNNHIVKIDASTGAILWQREFDPNRKMTVKIESGTGNIYIGSHFGSVNLVKINSSGTILWDKTYQVGSDNEYLGDFDFLPNGNVVMISNRNDNSSLRPTIRSINAADGTIAWERFISDALYDSHYLDGAVDSSGNIYVVGWRSNGVGQASNYEVYGFNSTGTLQWSNDWAFYDSNPGGGTVNTPQDISVIGNNVYISGAIDEFGSSIIRIKPDGTGLGTSLDTNFTYATVSRTVGTSITTVTDYTATSNAGTVSAPTTYNSVNVGVGATTVTDHPFS